MKNFKKKILTLGLAVAVFLTGIYQFGLQDTTNKRYYTNEENVKVTKLSVENHTKNEIAAMYKKLNIENVQKTKNVFKVKPSTKKPYATGTLSDTTVSNGIKMINFYRYIAGVDATVTKDAEKQKLAQAAALIQSLIKELDHQPEEKPSGMDNSLYNLCYQGSEISLLSKGEDNIAQSIDTFIYDHGNNDVGHRVCLLDPELKTVGIGMVDTFGTVCHKSDAFEKLMHSSNTAVAWPSYNTPVEIFKNNPYAYNTPYWSVSFAKDNIKNENIKVVLTRKKDGKKWTFSEKSSKLYVSDSTGTVTFEPGITTFKVGDSYNVKITGKTIDLDYNVNFFSVKSPNRSGTAPAPKITTTNKLYKYSTLQKKSVSFQIKATAKTEIIYGIKSYPYIESLKYAKGYLSGGDYVKISNSGKVTIKKGAPKGTYKFYAQSSTGTKYYYKSGKKIITIRVK